MPLPPRKTTLKDSLMRMPSLDNVKETIEEVKQDTGAPTLKDALDQKQIVVVTAPVSEVQSTVLQTTMKSNVVLGVSRQTMNQAAVDGFEDETGIDPEKSSHYLFDQVTKSVKVL